MLPGCASRDASFAETDLDESLEQVIVVTLNLHLGLLHPEVACLGFVELQLPLQVILLARPLVLFS